MIILPTRRRLERRRDALYKRLLSIIRHASVSQVEDIMRKIHGINLKLRNYLTKEQYETTEIFEYEDDFEEEETITTIPLDEITGEEPI